MIAKRQADDTYDRDVRIAWQTANLTRAEKVPPIQRLLTPKKQTLSEQRGMLEVLSARYGGALRKVKRIPQGASRGE